MRGSVFKEWEDITRGLKKQKCPTFLDSVEYAENKLMRGFVVESEPQI